MMSDNGKHSPDDDDLDVTVNAGNVETDSLVEGGKDTSDIPFCGCLSVRFYQPYFDVDTVEIISRISQAMFYCKRNENFLTYTKDKPDAYGPVWIATTLVFTVSVASHVNSWLLHWFSGKGNAW
jgi:hypothetical protein